MNILSLLLAVSAFSATPAPEAVTYGFSTASMDTKADPCSDFYQYACGGWLEHNQIPADQSRWSRFQELGERNKLTLRGILEARMADSAGRDAVDQKIGDYYASCMDEGAIEGKGTGPLKEDLTLIDSLTRDGLPALLARLSSSGVGAGLSFGVAPDYRDARTNIGHADQGGLGLPDRDYYFKTDEKSVRLRQDYQAHVAKMFELLGEQGKAAAGSSDVVMDFEIALASASQDKVARREPKNLDHKMTRAELSALAPGFDWEKYFAALGAPAFENVNAASPAFLTELAEMAAKESIGRWKTYLRWHLVHSRAALLSKAFVDEDFAFYGKTLTGAQELKPRWKRCVEFADAQLGEALGRRYVEQTFGEEGKKRTLEMVHGLEKALDSDIAGLQWMSAVTKKEAKTKLDAITNKIGFPDAWRDYSSLSIVRGDAAGNAARADAFETKRQLAKIGKPVDPKEWLMSPPTVNAYYDPQMNNINFPAGILQPPFYDNQMDDAVNYGGIGAVIGHELTHGFDDEGRQFAANGDLKDWWTKEDGEAF
ncbi:MAG: M13 family metallopeptidase [Elusimicrobia bacterium]|nr:M13 family metallopeptidase [Elusimicrobiota bacterium]